MGVGMRGAACIGTAAAVLLFPVAAHARTKTVSMGTPASKAKAFQKTGADANDFFPHGVTIHVGDKVKFLPPTTNLHSVDFPPKGGKPLGLITPTGTAIANVRDAAGNLFWFNGQQNVSFNPALIQQLGFGKRLAYNGRKRVTSGLPLDGRVKPLTVKFTRTGKYTYYCNVHFGMKGVVRVVRKSRRIPSARADRRRVKKQLKRDLSEAKKLAAGAKVPPNTVDVGLGNRHGVDFYGMLPGSLTVKAGTTVTFRMGPRARDQHTAAFGPGSPEMASTYLGQVEKGFNAPVPDPRGVYPSEPPGTVAALSPKLHGNGFWNTGVMDTAPATPLPSSGRVTFAAPGTYNYYCLIHTFMHGIITVTP